MVAKIRQFLSYVIPGVIRPLRVLWNEIIGFVFFALAVWAVPSSIRAYREFAEKGDTESLFRVVLAGLFVFIMIWFGVGSFRRARKINRSGKLDTPR